jgi:hypothetical protein
VLPSTPYLLRRVPWKAPPVVGGGAAAFTSPADTGTWTFSNANKTVVCTATANVGGVQTAQVLTSPALSGKKFFIAHVDSMPTDYASLGITDGANRGCPGFAGTGNVGFFSSSAGIWAAGSNVDSLPVSMGSGATAGLCIDASGKLAWFTLDGVNFYGSGGTVRTASDVAAGTGGFNLATYISASTFYAAVGALDTSGQGYTIQTSLPGGWSMPSGYSQL